MAAPLDELASAEIARERRRHRPQLVSDYSPAPPVRFLSAGEMLATPAPTKWLVRGVLVDSSITTIIGAAGSYKSNIAIDVAASVATGAEWHGRDCHQGAVFVLAGEGNHGIKRRLLAWSIDREQELNDAPLFVSTCGVGLGDPDHASAVAAEVERLAAAVDAKPVLVVVDTLARNFGPGDENSASDMGRFIAALDRYIRERFDCAVLIVHHSGHSENVRARGSSALRAAVDTEIIAERSDRTVTLRCTKSKDVPEFESITFEAKTIDLPWLGDDGTPETSFVLTPGDAIVESVNGAPSRRIGANQVAGLKALQVLYADAQGRLVAAGMPPDGAAILVAEWRDKLKMKPNRFGELKAGLERAKLIRIEPPHVYLEAA
jgi:hypothetical protein